MSLGPVMLDLAGTELSAEDLDLLKHPAVGGVILFARNYHDPDQLTALTTAIRSVRESQLLVATDQEGGRVQRFRDGFCQLPAAGEYGKLYDKSPQAGHRLTELMGWLMASELQACGVDYSFAPVLDIDRGICSVVGNRAFHRDAEIVGELGKSWMQGVRRAGMVAVAKHFPGHGGVAVDSHLALPRDERSFDSLWQEDILPFQTLIGQGLEAVMPAHVVYPAVDDMPAGFSSRWLKDILRGRMGFQGVIVSDALDMAAAAVAGGDVERSKAALDAGCDQLLVCNNRTAAIKVVEALVDYDQPLSQARLMRLYSRHFIGHERLQENPSWLQAKAMLAEFAVDSYVNLVFDPTTRGGKVL